MDIVLLKFDWLIFIVKLLLAVGCGYCIGIERSTLGKPAGVKTHTLICLGACIFTHFSIMTAYGDPTRIAAQVVTGIGFIGAGTIMQSRYGIEGLTSASLVFVNAAVGMLIGGNLFFYSLISTAVVLGVFKFLQGRSMNIRQLPFKIELICKQYGDVEQLIEKIDALNCRILKKQIEKDGSRLQVSIKYSTTPLTNHRVLSLVHRLPSVVSFNQT